MSALLCALIRVYQLTLSRVLVALFGPVCRFEPSCSRYAFACVRDHGALRGSLLSVKRLCKCHPFHPGGFDPPPPPPRSARSGAVEGSPPRDTHPRDHAALPRVSAPQRGLPDPASSA